MKTIAIANQKGGVGKTTTANTLIAGLSQKGYKVLAIDLDPQTNLTTSLGAEPKGATALGVLTGEIETAQAIVKTATGDLIPGNYLLANAESYLDATGKEYRLKEALEPIASKYDYVVIDTPPALSILTINALTSSDYVVVPAKADLYSLQGIDQLAKTIKTVKKYCNPNIKVAGILLTMYNDRTNITKEVAELVNQLSSKLDAEVFRSTIRNSIKATELQFKPGGLFSYAPRENITKDYEAWIEELLKTIKKGA